MKTTIVVTGVENKGKKTNILANGVKYNFWNTKQDGNLTKAQEGFQTLRPMIGDTLTAEVETKDSSFTNTEGKEIKYKDNQILFFYTDTHQATRVSAPTQKPTEEMPVIQIDEEFDASYEGQEFQSYVKTQLQVINSKLDKLVDDGFKIEDVPFN